VVVGENVISNGVVVTAAIAGSPVQIMKEHHLACRLTTVTLRADLVFETRMP